MEAIAIVPAVILLAVAAVAMVRWQHGRARQMLERWAAQNGYRIEESSFCFFGRGPFTFRSSKGQMVYRVVVKDETGRRRGGYARCGGWFLGILSDQVTVHFD